MRLGWVELWATWENRSVVKAIMALASLRDCSGVGASLQSSEAFFRSVWPSGSCRDISGVSGGQGSHNSVLKICFTVPGPMGSRALSQACLIHSGDWMPSSVPHPLSSALSPKATPPTPSPL